MSYLGVQNNQNSHKMITPTGAFLGVVGMSAYHLPITKGRFVRNAFDVKTKMVEDNIALLSESAYEISKNKLSSDNKLFLSQLGVAETFEEISNKCAELKKSVTDDGLVKTAKEFFENNFEAFKKSEATQDIVVSKAFKKIRWTNFAWGAFIGLVIGNVLEAGRNK